VRKARDRYENEYRRPLERRGEVPDYIRFSSDKDSVNFEVAQASHSQLGAPNNPPAATEKHDVTMRLHQSAIDNYLNHHFRQNGFSPCVWSYRPQPVSHSVKGQ